MIKKKILVLVEGQKTDVRLMNHLFSIYKIDAKYEIVSYNTNIYTLYNEMFRDGKPDELDLLQVLKAREKDVNRKEIFNVDYTDILLIFDLDPQDSSFSPRRIAEMLEYFSESSDMGKLYINYPMVEAFYHMSSIPDENYNSYTVTIKELQDHTYKQRVNAENRNHDYAKFATTREECNIVISQNIEKGFKIQNKDIIERFPNTTKILEEQLNLLGSFKMVYVLCICVFFIVEYNPELISRGNSI